MNDQYEECGWTSEKLADEELFIREVIREDTDLMLVDCLLREAFRRLKRKALPRTGSAFCVSGIRTRICEAGDVRFVSGKRASEVPTKLESFLLSRDTCLFYCLLVIRFM